MQKKSDFFEFVPCYSCGSNNHKEIRKSLYPNDLKIGDILKIYSSSSDSTLLDRLVLCNKCGLIFISPRIKSSIIINSYTENHDAKFITQNKFRIITFESQLKKIITKFKLSNNISVLDIGCAGGAFLKACKNLQIRAVGIEPNRWLVDFAKKEYDVDARKGILSDHNFNKEFFDVISLWDVIEHLTNPKKVISESLFLLKPGGLLILNFPDISSFAAKILKKKWPFYLGVHLIYFTPKTLEKFLEPMGFTKVLKKPHWQSLSLSYILERAEAYFIFFKYLKKLFNFVGLKNISVKYNVGQTLMVFQKKEIK